MNLLDHPALLSVAAFLGGALAGYWLLRWKERNLRAARCIEQKALVDGARREADAIAREGRAKASEDALSLRRETETSFAQRRADHHETERRLAERESLINRQLQSVVEEERALREQQELFRQKTAALDAQRDELAALARRRRDELQA
ncbi:MAG TPA: Rnase Y domain-containing protein, partial [Verrucomicrobiae bacterium]|nr:Rnase Y domain-containing protein [Verrucomicrobiae bacterium]